jgi:hypothetical protein
LEEREREFKNIHGLEYVRSPQFNNNEGHEDIQNFDTAGHISAIIKGPENGPTGVSHIEYMQESFDNSTFSPLTQLTPSHQYNRIPGKIVKRS